MTIPAGAWVPDVLGEGFVARTIPLGFDEEGELTATLVRALPDAAASPGAHRQDPAAPSEGETSPAVLYVHGYNDYFFQRHLARAFLAHGIAFYALDLRKCGRSLHEGQTPFFTQHLAEYGEELGMAHAIITGEDGHGPVLAMGHSTGGLIVALWADALAGTGALAGLILNSPWLDFAGSFLMRTLGTTALDVLGPLGPMAVLDTDPSAYSRHLHVSNGGEWEYDPALKPWTGFPVRAGWLRAVRLAQAQVGKGLGIDIPILVACSQESGPNREDNPDLERVDAVLDVAQIQARAPGLGSDVTLCVIPGGIHDLSLSAPPARTLFCEHVFAWTASHGWGH